MIVLEEKQENYQTVLSTGDITDRLRCSLCTFKLEVQKMCSRTTVRGTACTLFSSWLNALLKFDCG